MVLGSWRAWMTPLLMLPSVELYFVSAIMPNMRKALLIILLALGFVTNIPASHADDKKTVAPITTYTPAAGDKLKFDIVADDGAKATQEVSIASINTNGSIKVEILLYEGKGENLNVLVNAEATWNPNPKFLEALKGVEHTKEQKSIVIGRKRIQCTVVTIDNTELWIASNPQQTSTAFPGLVLLKEGDTVKLRLKKITTGKPREVH